MPLLVRGRHTGVAGATSSNALFRSASARARSATAEYGRCTLHVLARQRLGKPVSAPSGKRLLRPLSNLLLIPEAIRLISTVQTHEPYTSGTPFALPVKGPALAARS